MNQDVETGLNGYKHDYNGHGMNEIIPLLNIDLKTKIDDLASYCLAHNDIDESYLLTKKLKEKFGGDNPLSKLIYVFKNEGMSEYYYLCLMIIYYYFDEFELRLPKVNEIKIEEENTNAASSNEGIAENMLNEIPTLIGDVLSINSYDYKIEMLKLLSIYLNKYSSNYEDLKERMLKALHKDHESELAANRLNSLPQKYKYVDNNGVATLTPLCSKCGRLQYCAKDDHTCKNLHQLRALKPSYTSAVNFCNRKFFKLVFLLKELQLSKFKIEFSYFIEAHKKLFGEFWFTEIKPSIRLLYHMSKILNILHASEFILISNEKYNFEQKGLLRLRFRNCNEFVVGRIDLMYIKDWISLKKFIDNDFKKYLGTDKDIYYEIDKFKKKFKNTPKIRKLLFGRLELTEKSLFEEILSLNMTEAQDEYVLEYIWHEFKLYESPETITMKNPMGETWLDYVLKTNNDQHLISFNELKTGYYQEQFMILKDMMLYDRKNGESLMDFQFNLIKESTKDDVLYYKSLHSLLYLLEEMDIFYPEQNIKTIENYKAIIKEVMNIESEPCDDTNESKLARKHFLVGILMIYGNYEQVILNNNNKLLPHYELLGLILDKKEQKFLENFPREMPRIEILLKLIYKYSPNNDLSQQHKELKTIQFYTRYLSTLAFLMLYAAIKTDQSKIVDFMFSHNKFLTVDPIFPNNMGTDKIHLHTATRFLENRYEISRECLPKKWFTLDIMTEFLRSRVTDQHEFYKIDCRFMLPYYNYDVPPPKKVSNGAILNEDYLVMKYFVNSDVLQYLLIHPVMEMITRVKYKKYHPIMWTIILAFIFMYILPTVGLAYQYHTTWKNYWIFWPMIVLRVVFFIPREYFHYRVYYRNNYFDAKLKISEITLMSIPFTTTILYILAYLGISHSTSKSILTLLEFMNLVIIFFATKSTIRKIKFIIVSVILIKLFSIMLLGLCFFTVYQIIINEYPESETLGFISRIPIVKYFGLEGPIEMMSQIELRKTLYTVCLLIAGVISLRNPDDFDVKYFARKYVDYAEKLRIFFAITDNGNNINVIDNRLMMALFRLSFYIYPHINNLQSIYVCKKSNIFYTADEKITNPTYPFSYSSPSEFYLYISSKIRTLLQSIYEKIVGTNKLNANQLGELVRHQHDC